MSKQRFVRSALERPRSFNEIHGGCSLRILLFANTDWYLYNFRKNLADYLTSRGHEVILASPAGKYASQLANEFRWFKVDIGGGSRNPVSNLQAYRQIDSLYAQVQPDLVHHFTIKCVLYGGASARRRGTPCVNAVTGLGHLFTHRSLINRATVIFIKRLYNYVLNAPRSKVIFQNEENRQFFLSHRLVDPAKTQLIRGSGADCSRFYPNSQPRPPGPCRILFASRLLREKGIMELLEAARTLRNEKEEFELLVAGEPYPGNPSSIDKSEFASLKTQCTYLGHVDDMRPVFAQADVVVLPSYAEGTPRVLLEAGACGIPLIATDIAGCQGVVEHDVNGFLVPVQDVASLTSRLRQLIRSPELRGRMGCESRRIIVNRFSDEIVLRETYRVYRSLIPSLSDS